MPERIEIDKMEKIIKLTEEGNFRSDIAKELDVCERTVYNYQKKLNLI